MPLAFGNAARSASCVELERMPAVAQPHLDRERVLGLGEVVAEHAVERREHRLALGPRRALAEERRELREREVDARRRRARHAADAAVDQPVTKRAGPASGCPRTAGPPRSCGASSSTTLGHAARSRRRRAGSRRADRRRGCGSSSSRPLGYAPPRVPNPWRKIVRGDIVGNCVVA